MHPQITLCRQVVDQEPRRTERQRQTRGDLCDRGAVHARRQDLAPHIISPPARRLRCGVERFDRSLECQFDTGIGTAFRQREWPHQARLVRGFRFCEPVADRLALALRLRARRPTCGELCGTWRFAKYHKVWSACTDARTSLATTLRMVRSVSMTNVVRLTGSSRASRPRRRACRPRRVSSRVPTDLRSLASLPRCTPNNSDTTPSASESSG